MNTERACLKYIALTHNKFIGDGIFELISQTKVATVVIGVYLNLPNKSSYSSCQFSDSESPITVITGALLCRSSSCILQYINDFFFIPSDMHQICSKTAGALSRTVPQ